MNFWGCGMSFYDKRYEVEIGILERGVSWIFVGICWVECNGDVRGVRFGVGVWKNLI